MTAAIDRVETHLLSLLTTAAKHEKWLESIDHRLGVLNGNVSRHEVSITDLKTFAIAHPAQCEVGAKVDQLAAKIAENRLERQADIDRVKAALDKVQAVEEAERETKEKTDTKWNKRVHPVIVAGITLILTVLAILILQTPDTFRKALTH